MRWLDEHYKNIRKVVLVICWLLFYDVSNDFDYACNWKQWKAIIPIGLAFWFFAISGYILLIVANVEFKRISGNLRKNKRSLPGIISFFSNKIAMIADVAVIISIVAFVIICITELRFKYIAFVTLFLLIFSLHMHCLFNGRIYKLIKMKRRDINYEQCEK